VIEAAGSTSLVNVSNHFFLDNISTGLGPSLRLYGADVVANQMGGWTPIGVEQTASGYLVAWKMTGLDQYTAWAVDGSGNYLSSPIAYESGASAALKSIETSLHQDLNGDGVIGVVGNEASPGQLDSGTAKSVAEIGLASFNNYVNRDSTVSTFGSTAPAPPETLDNGGDNAQAINIAADQINAPVTSLLVSKTYNFSNLHVHEIFDNPATLGTLIGSGSHNANYHMNKENIHSLIASAMDSFAVSYDHGIGITTRTLHHSHDFHIG